AYENEFILGGTYTAGVAPYSGTLSGGTLYDNGVAQSGLVFKGLDNYDGGNGTVANGTADSDTLQIYVSVQQSNDTAFMKALGNEIDYFTKIWLPAHANAQTGQADQSVYQFQSINLKI